MAEAKSTCTICAAQFTPKPYKANLYCGMSCYRVAQKRGDYRRGSNVKNQCDECGEEFYGRGKTKKRNGERADKLFCSRSCYDTHRAKIRGKKRKRCNHCQTEFQPHNKDAKFCCWDCRASNLKAKPKHCICCGCWFTPVKPIQRHYGVEMISVSNAKTCSPECQNEWIRINPERKRKISEAFQADKHPNWQGGSHYGGSRGPGWQKIAERCRERFGRQCGDCGMSEADSIAKGWGRLEVNHKIPFHQWRNKQKANAQSNLEALCKSCHMKKDWQWRKENPVQMSLSIFR